MKKSFFLCFALCHALYASPIVTHYLEEAELNIKANNYEMAAHYGNLVLKYDETNSDALYYLAVCSGKKLSKVKSYLKAAFAFNNWNNYTKKDAKLLYVSSLLETGKTEEALKMLDEKDETDDKEATLLRIKALYKQKTDKSVSKARKEAYKACKLYGDDERFEELFFKNEYALRDYDSDRETVEKIKNTYLARFTESDAAKKEFAVYLIASVDDKNERTRLLKAYNASKNKHPLYAILAKKDGVLSDSEALSYFKSLPKKEMSFELFREFFSILSEEAVIEEASSYLLSYGDTLTFDTDNDRNPNLFVTYKNGRPKFARFDFDNDAEDEWKCDFDAGNPTNAKMKTNDAEVVYARYPYASHLDLTNKTLIFDLERDKYKVALFEIAAEKMMREKYKIDFFFLINPKLPATINTNEIFLYSNSCTVKTESQDGKYIKFDILDGVTVSGKYFTSKNVNYAKLFFEKGLPYKRIVDTDYDGIFETTEIYGYDKTRRASKKNVKDEVFSSFFSATLDIDGVYLEKILLDRNKDNRVDFVEEYFRDGEKTVSYDTNYDGKNDIIYTKRKKGGRIDEESVFLDEVYIASKNGECLEVRQTSAEPLKVLRGKNDKFYWIGQCGPEDMEKIVMEKCKLLQRGAVFATEKNGIRSLSIEIMGKFYSKIIPKNRRRK